MKYLLRRGVRTPNEIAQELNAKLETVNREIRRYKNDFVVFENGNVGLRETTQ